MATCFKIRRLPNREAKSLYKISYSQDDHTWHMKYYNPKARKRINKAKKLAKRMKLYNNHH